MHAPGPFSLFLLAAASVESAFAAYGARHGARQASSTVSTVSEGSSSVTDSSSQTETASAAPTPIATTTTVLTTSSGPNGTSTFLTTVTTLLISGTTTTANSSTQSTQTTTSFPSLSTYDTCVTNCFAQGVSQANCSSLTDVACYCGNSDFAPLLYECVVSQCANDVNSVETLAQQFCDVASPSISLSFPASGNSSASSSSSSASASASTSGSSAQALTTSFSGHWIGLSAGLLGLVFGVALV